MTVSSIRSANCVVGAGDTIGVQTKKVVAIIERQVGMERKDYSVTYRVVN